ncbi:hypothetical protein VTH06DRAFT_1697 [Thermothelomyces fergusii]
MEGRYVEGAYAMGPRIPVRRRDAIETGVSTLGFRIPSRVLVGRSDSDECKNPNGCTKPIGASTTTIAIVLGIVIPLVAALTVLFFLHRRNVRKQRQEDLHDPHKSLDFGLEGGAPAKESRKSLISREKEGGQRFNRQQMSMDMNLSSPYLLPPDAHNSRESLNSLAKSLQQNEDPYKQVSQYAGSEAGSIRSFRRSEVPGPHQNSIPMSPLQPPEPSHTRPERPQPESAGGPPGGPTTNGPPPPIGTAISDSGDGQKGKPETGAAAQEPSLNVPKSLAVPQPRRSRPSPPDSAVAVDHNDDGRNPFEKPVAQEVDTPTEPSTVGLGLSSSTNAQRVSMRSSTSSYKSRAASPPPQKEQKVPASAPVIEEPQPVDYFDFNFAETLDTSQGRRSSSPSPANRKNGQSDEDEPRGRNMQRTSHLFEQKNAGGQGGLGVPQQGNRRLSVGFRPLPPDEIMESEDPEYRANRIRSFYKEYFEETKPEDRPPVPPLPPMVQKGDKQQHRQSKASYYEDYDASYLQDAPYFDPATNSFVMPYAQPVSRRAMTPPPSGERFPGPRGTGRGSHGSQASARFPPNMRGPPRPGSSVSNQLGGPSRPGSASSAGRMRAGSAMSGSRAPKKPVPPPADLPTLPTPAKLADDSFALFNAADFAPPDTFAERARGRSQSPCGERRPYKMPVPAHSPLASSYDELPALPSPHLLRKSGTFTALDFAPPRKFADSENGNDAGSIRSNRSGLTALHANAIRNGAGRVSRLPEDQVFTQAALSKTLKPQWNMRE